VLRAERCGVQIQAVARNFHLLLNVQIRRGGPLSLISSGYVGSYPWVKLPGCAVGHSSASGVEFGNVWSCTCTLFFLCLHGVDKDIVVFFFLFFYFLQVRSCIVYFLLAAHRQEGKLERCNRYSTSLLLR